jgi:hypothetical protein
VVSQLAAPLPELKRLTGLMIPPWNAVVIARALRIRLWPIEPGRQQARVVEMLLALQHWRRPLGLKATASLRCLHI